MSKYKKTVPLLTLFIFWRSYAPLSLCLFIFYATIVMKRYLITFYAHLLQNIRLFSIFTYKLSSVVHCATLNNFLAFVTDKMKYIYLDRNYWAGQQYCMRGLEIAIIYLILDLGKWACYYTPWRDWKLQLFTGYS